MPQSPDTEEPEFFQAGTKIITVKGAVGTDADGDKVLTGRNAEGVIERVLPDQENCYFVVFEKSGANIFLSKEKLADGSRYAIKDDYPITSKRGSILVNASIGVDVPAYQEIHVAVPILDDGSPDPQAFKRMVNEMWEKGELTAFEPDWSSEDALRIESARDLSHQIVAQNLCIDSNDVDAGQALRQAIFGPQASQDPQATLGALLGAAKGAAPNLTDEQILQAVRDFSARLSIAVLDHDAGEAAANKPHRPRG